MEYRRGQPHSRVPPHDETTALLRGLALVQTALAHRQRELRADPAFSDVTYELSINGPTLAEDFSEDVRDSIRDMHARGGRQIVISGYVDATPKGHHGSTWAFDIAEGEQEQWSLDREVTLYPREGDDLIVPLPTFTFTRWAEVAEPLPRLIAELLGTPLPFPRA